MAFIKLKPVEAIWLLKNDNWRRLDDLKNVFSTNKKQRNVNLIKADSRASAIMIENSIIIVSGSSRPNAIQQLNFEEDQLIDQRVLGKTFSCNIPVLLEVPATYCF